MPPSSLRRPRAVRDSSRFLLLPPPPLVAFAVAVAVTVAVSVSVAVAVAVAAVAAAAGRRVRSSSLFDAGDCLGREVVVVVVGPARPAALRVPWTDVLSI